MIIALAVGVAGILVAALIAWHARRSTESGVSALWWAVRDIHEWHRR